MKKPLLGVLVICLRHLNLIWFRMPSNLMVNEATFSPFPCVICKILHQDIKQCHCSENNCELVQNVRNTSSRAHILSHICHCPFERPHYAFWNHQLWVVILYALNLMVPLFKRYLCFTRGNVTTKSINFWSGQVQT